MYGAYVCNQLGCNVGLHEECAEAPLEINHPFHPEHRILLINDVEDSSLHKFGQCYLCGQILSPLRYRCSTCDFRVDITCGMKPSPHAIEHPLCHHHPIIYKRYQNSPCEVCKESIRGPSYVCIECEVYFHVKCIHFSKEVNHPCHSNHPLELTAFDTLTDDAEKSCLLCEKQPNVCYHCSICNFTTCLLCVRSPPPLVVEHKKTHQHPLTRLSKRISYICDVCGLQSNTKRYHGSYICHLCDFVIHGTCIGFPRVISINRHIHRISFTQHLGTGYSKCGVCHQSISQYYGAYSCSVCPKYAVHSECAVGGYSTVWDGVELEGIPDDTEDIAPYKVVGDDLINHVSHVKHPLKFHKDNILYDHEWIRCEACINPVGFDSIYVCEECCFLLHEKCANLPTKNKHFFDVRPYMLEVDNVRVVNDCWLCSTLSDGFKYSSQGRSKVVDVRCCSLSEPFIHAGHLHPLYFQEKSTDNWRKCDACMKFPYIYALHCDACNFDLCLFCATLPLKVRHRNDEHPLILCFGKKESGQSWCDFCERKLDPSLWFYACSDCGVTLHSGCVIGDFSRIHAGSTIEFEHVEKIFEAVPNNQNTRPLCSRCHSRCTFSVIVKDQNEDNGYFCSRLCLKTSFGLDL